MSMTIYLEVDLDDKELPLKVADSTKELAEMCGVQHRTILQNIYQAKKRNGKCRYVRVEIDEDDD